MDSHRNLPTTSRCQSAQDEHLAPFRVAIVDVTHAIEDGRIKCARIDESVERILLLKGK